MEKKPPEYKDPEELATQLSIWFYKRFRFRPPPLAREILPICRGKNMMKILNYLVNTTFPKDDAEEMRRRIKDYNLRHQNALDRKYAKIEKKVKKQRSVIRRLYEEIQMWHKKVDGKKKSMRNVVRYFTSNFSFGEQHKLNERKKYESSLERLLQASQTRLGTSLELVHRLKEANEKLRTRRVYHQEQMDLFIPTTSPFFRKKNMGFRFTTDLSFGSEHAQSILYKRKQLEMMIGQNPKKLMQILKSEHLGFIKDLDEEMYLNQIERSMLKKNRTEKMKKIFIEAELERQEEENLRKMSDIINRKQREHISMFSKIRNCDLKIEQLEREYAREQDKLNTRLKTVFFSDSTKKKRFNFKTSFECVSRYMELERRLSELCEVKKHLKNQIFDVSQIMDDQEEKDVETKREMEVLMNELKGIQRDNMVQFHSNEEMILDLETQVDRIKQMYRERNVVLEKYKKINNHSKDLEDYFVKKLQVLNQNNKIVE